MVIEDWEVNRGYAFGSFLGGSTKIIIGIVIFLVGIYYLSDWLSIRDRIANELRNDRIVMRQIGSLYDYSMSNSKQEILSECDSEKECKKIKRFVFKLSGQMGETIYVSLDYNKKTKETAHKIYCLQPYKVFDTEEDYGWGNAPRDCQ